MRARIAALTVALLAAGCGGEEPAQPAHPPGPTAAQESVTSCVERWNAPANFAPDRPGSDLAELADDRATGAIHVNVGPSPDFPDLCLVSATPTAAGYDRQWIERGGGFIHKCTAGCVEPEQREANVYVGQDGSLGFEGD